jgi:hypothetical protein
MLQANTSYIQSSHEEEFCRRLMRNNPNSYMMYIGYKIFHLFRYSYQIIINKMVLDFLVDESNQIYLNDAAFIDLSDPEKVFKAFLDENYSHLNNNG